MARKHPLWKFWFWIGANPVWDLVKLAGGTTLVNSSWTVLKAEMHHHPVDWILFGVYVVAGVALLALGVHFDRKKKDDPIPESIPTSEDGVSEIVGFGGRDTLEEAQAEHARVMSVGNKLDGAFTMLQIEAICLANFLQRFMDSLEPAPAVREGQSYDEVRGKAYVWGIKVKTLYERDCAPDVKRFVQRAKIEMGYTSRALDNYQETVHGVENIETVRAQLWLFVIRTLQVDFTGEI